MSIQDINHFIALSRKEQEKIKPQVEDIVNVYLDGDTRKNALDFIKFIKVNGFTFNWGGINTWYADYKKKCICMFKLHSGNKRPLTPQDLPNWVIHVLIDLEKHHDSIVEEDLHHIIWDGTDYCVHKNYDGKSNVGCRTTKGCSGGKTIILFNKEFSGMCIHFNPRFSNPDRATIDGIKRLLGLEIERTK